LVFAEGMLGGMKSAGVFVRVVALVAGLAATGYAQTANTPQQFLELWGKAWDSHDVDAIMRLHADDCVSVNRFGVMASGKDEIRRSVTWLHNGPFHTAHFGPPKLMDQRKLAPGVLAVHASWKNPSGRQDPPEDDLVMTLVLRDLGSEGWVAEAVDTHTVEPLAPAVAPEAAAAK
jgi:uncharacterized protein (TIGR02246 family)